MSKEEQYLKKDPYLEVGVLKSIASDRNLWQHFYNKIILNEPDLTLLHFLSQHLFAAQAFLIFPYLSYPPSGVFL